jgi:catechol 2,3-dioxygenase-like lactoylglutathione lyase family enzyme
MPRGLDHIVHAVRDLDAAAEFYRRAGFQVGARNRHPWGTHNHVVQFPGFFIEILTVGEPDKLGADGLSQRFGIPGREAIKRGDGLAMLVLESTDSEADAADFARSGIGISQPLPFSRAAVLPDGRATTVGFSLVFVKDAQSPDTTFFTCRQHNPAAFWKPDYQLHPNGATGVRGAVLVAANPADHRGFLAAWTAVRDVRDDGACITASTPRGEIAIMTPAEFTARFGVAVAAGEGLAIRGLRLAATDVTAVADVLAGAGIEATRQSGAVVVPPSVAFGATLIFEQATAN